MATPGSIVTLAMHALVAVADAAPPGSRAVLAGLEDAVINDESTNLYPKIANNAVMRNRADGASDPGQPMNVSSIAY